MSINYINVEAFILDIFARQPIWDGSFGNKDFYWGQISENHDYLPIAALKTKWENLRRSFRNQPKKIPRNLDNQYLIDPHDVQSTWPYYQSMLFLVNRVRLAQQHQLVQDVVESVERSAEPPVARNVSQKRPNADSVEKGTYSASKKIRFENAAPVPNIKRSDSDLSDVMPILKLETVYEPQKNALTKSVSLTTLNWEDDKDSNLIEDSDRFYLESLLPYLERLDVTRKLIVRSKIDEILRVEISNM